MQPFPSPSPRPPSLAQTPPWRRARLWWTAFVLWNLALFCLSSLNGERLPSTGIPNFDKVEHAGFFAAGFGLFTVALGLTRLGSVNNGPARWKLIALGALGAAVCGALDEFHQIFTPHRSGLDPGDWTADVLGGTLGALAATRLLGFFTRDRSAAPATAGTEAAGALE